MHHEKEKTIIFPIFVLLLTGMGLVALQLNTHAEGEPYFQYCSVMAMNTPDRVKTALYAKVVDANGTVPGSIDSFTVECAARFDIYRGLTAFYI